MIRSPLPCDTATRKKLARRTPGAAFVGRFATMWLPSAVAATEQTGKFKQIGGRAAGSTAREGTS